MSTLAWIIVASLLGGVLSVAAAAIFAFNARTAHVPILISYAVGALLGAVFLDILPHAFSMTESPERIAATILIGILIFFVLEKLVLWRHCHVEQCEAHEAQPAQHDHGRSGMMIMVGDTFHNFVDGILIAAAFLADMQLGLVTSIAIIAHDVFEIIPLPEYLSVQMRCERFESLHHRRQRRGRPPRLPCRRLPVVGLSFWLMRFRAGVGACPYNNRRTTSHANAGSAHAHGARKLRSSSNVFVTA